MTRKRLLAIGLLAASPAAAQPAAPPAIAATPAFPADYSSDAMWLCLPDRADSCEGPLPTVDLGVSGYGAVRESRAAASPRADCFYVYPTVSGERTLNSDLVPDPAEQSAARSQLARFAEVCRTFAPMYRQVTNMGLGAAMAGGDVSAVFDIAYADVRAAFRQFRARRARGRPFLLIGHSQGSIHLLKLLQEEIEGKAAARDMVAAYLLGWNVQVPLGQPVGGSLRSTPLCSRMGQTGCVVSYMSFRETVPPEPGGLFARADTPVFGRPPTPGMTTACVNPATLATGPALMDSIWPAGFSTNGEPTAWSSEGPPPARFVRTHGLVTARCVNDGPAGYLSVRVNADPADPRTDTIPGDVTLFGQPVPSWGLHPADTSIGMGDLIRLARTQIAAFRRR